MRLQQQAADLWERTLRSVDARATIIITNCYRYIFIAIITVEYCVDGAAVHQSNARKDLQRVTATAAVGKP